jgi:hypothetical protein
MVIDVDQGGDAIALLVQRLRGFADAGAGKVAYRFRPVLGKPRAVMMRSSSTMSSSSMVMVTRCMGQVPDWVGSPDLIISLI